MESQITSIKTQLRKLRIQFRQSIRNAIKDGIGCENRNERMQIRKQSRIFICPLCKKEFKSAGGLSIHQSHHTFTPSEIKCAICDKNFDSYGLLKKHHDRVHPEKEFQDNLSLVYIGKEAKRTQYACKSCPKIFHHVLVYKKHMRTSHPEEYKKSLYKCPHPKCNREFDTNQGLVIHLGFHSTNDLVFKCTFCSVSFSAYAELRIHQIEDHEKEVRAADVISSSSSSDIVRSLKRNVLAKKSYKCDICSLSFGNIQVFKNHILNSGHQSKEAETTMIQKKCLTCNKEFPSDRGFHIHQNHCKQQSTERKASWCSICKLDYYKPIYLEGHNEKHHRNVNELVGNGKQVVVHKETQNNIKCTQTNCDARFPDVYKLDMHLAVLHEERARCSTCGKIFEHSRILLRHQKSHTTVLYKCSKPDCDSEFKSFSTFVAHDRKHDNLHPYPCPVCPESFLTKALMKAHRIDVHKEKLAPSCTPASLRLVCEKCGESFASRASLKEHITRIHMEKTVPCDICKYNFATVGDLRKHKKSAHFLVDSFICETCGQRFSCGSTLRMHARIHLPDNEKPFICKDCGKAFSQKRAYEDHWRIHTGEKKYNCSICKKSWRSSLSLRVHLISKICVDPEKQICHICGNKFKNQHYLDLHMSRVHNNETPPNGANTCDFCGKHFFFKSALMEHRFTHTKEKLFQCLRCCGSTSTFAQRSGLYQHNRIHHPNTKASYLFNGKDPHDAEGKTWKRGRKRKYEGMNPGIGQSLPSTLPNNAEDMNTSIRVNTDVLNAAINTVGDGPLNSQDFGDQNDTDSVQKMPPVLQGGDNSENSCEDSGTLPDFAFEEDNGSDVDATDAYDKEVQSTSTNIKLKTNLSFSQCNPSLFGSHSTDDEGLEIIENKVAKFSTQVYKHKPIVPNSSRIYTETQPLRQLVVRLERLTVYPCNVCKVVFPSEREYRTHRRSRDHVKRIRAFNKTRDSKVKQIKLREQKQKQKKLESESSGNDERQSLKSEQRFKKYTKRQRERTKSCRLCNETFFRKKDLLKHLEDKHVGQLPYKCRICDRDFIIFNKVVQHFQSSHPGQKPLICDCGVQFQRANHLKRHNAEVHGTRQRPKRNDGPIRKYRPRYSTVETFCKICQKDFKNLRHHLTVHSTEAHNLCDLCGQTFKQKSNLTVHRRIHTGEKPYVCKDCQSAYVSAGDLKKHVDRVHRHIVKTRHGAKHVACSFCPEMFTSEKAIKYHMGVHDTNRPFVCHICLFRFNHRSNVTTHMKLVHSKPKIPTNA